MLPVQSPTTQPRSESDRPKPNTNGEAPLEDTGAKASSASTSKRSRPSWYRGPKRYLGEWQRVVATSTPERFLWIFFGQGGLGKAVQSHGHIVHSFDIKNGPHQDVLDKACAKHIRQFICKISCMGVWFGMPCSTFTSARRYDGKGPNLSEVVNTLLASRMSQDVTKCAWTSLTNLVN